MLLAETVTLIVCVKEVLRLIHLEKQESIPVGCVRTAAVARGLAYPPPRYPTSPGKDMGPGTWKDPGTRDTLPPPALWTE